MSRVEHADETGIEGSVIRMPRKTSDARLIEVLAALPFCTREEVGCLAGLDDNIVRNGLERLFRAGKADRVGHIRLRRRRVWRYFLTGTGVLELARQRSIDVAVVLADMPVSREWGRILAQRLDIVEVAYRLAILAGSSGEPVRWQWRAARLDGRTPCHRTESLHSGKSRGPVGASKDGTVPDGLDGGGFEERARPGGIADRAVGDGYGLDAALVRGKCR